jgi:hypothetical protein
MKTKIAILTAALSLVVVSCKKRFDNDMSALMNYKIETAFDEMTNISDQAITGNMVYYKVGEIITTKPEEKPVTLKTPCNVIITLDTINSVKTVTVDYGTSNCDCNDGKTRRGKIVTTFTGQYFAPGTVITHTPVDYYVNDIKYDGTKTVTNMGLNGTGQPYFNVQIEVGCSFPVAGTLEMTPQNKPVRTVDYGQGTCDYAFTVTVNGVTYNFSI